MVLYKDLNFGTHYGVTNITIMKKTTSGQAHEALKGMYFDFEASLGAFNLYYRVKMFNGIAY